MTRGPPPRGRILPSLYPDRDVVGEYKLMYGELISTGISQTEALHRVAHAFGGISRTTLRRYVIPKDIEVTKKYMREYWATDSHRPGGHNRMRARRLWVRRHLEKVLEEAFRLVEGEPQELHKLASLVERVTNGVVLRPSSLLTANCQYEERMKRPLLELVNGAPPRYRLYRV